MGGYFRLMKDIFRIFRRELRYILFICGVLGASFVAVWAFGSTFWGGFEPIIGVATLVVAIAVWVGERREAMREALPKRLTVVFLYPLLKAEDNENVALFCSHAYLSNVADIRSLGQSIGGQMAEEQLRFYPDIRQSPGCNEIHNGEEVFHYTVIFQLYEAPKKSGPGWHFGERKAMEWKLQGDGTRKKVWTSQGVLKGFTVELIT